MTVDPAMIEEAAAADTNGATACGGGAVTSISMPMRVGVGGGFIVINAATVVEETR
jgi:hypothetical protein